MLVNEKVAIEHGLKADEYKKICKLLERTPNIRPNGTTGIINGLTSITPLKKTLRLLFIFRKIFY